MMIKNEMFFCILKKLVHKSEIISFSFSKSIYFLLLQVSLVSGNYLTLALYLIALN